MSNNSSLTPFVVLGAIALVCFFPGLILAPLLGFFVGGMHLHNTYSDYALRTTTGKDSPYYTLDIIQGRDNCEEESRRRSKAANGDAWIIGYSVNARRFSCTELDKMDTDAGRGELALYRRGGAPKFDHVWHLWAHNPNPRVGWHRPTDRQTEFKSRIDCLKAERILDYDLRQQGKIRVGYYGKNWSSDCYIVGNVIIPEPSITYSELVGEEAYESGPVWSAVMDSSPARLFVRAYAAIRWDATKGPNDGKWWELKDEKGEVLWSFPGSKNCEALKEYASFGAAPGEWEVECVKRPWG